jgi:hypothetical protein
MLYARKTFENDQILNKGDCWVVNNYEGEEYLLL